MKKVFRRPTALALVAVATVSFAVFIVASATAATKHKGERGRLRPAAGHEVVGALGAVRQARHGRRLQEGRRLGVDQQRPERPAQAEGAGAGLHRSGREGRHRDGPRQRLRRVDREALHLEGRQGDRLRPPGHRRHGLGLRHVRRQGASARRRPNGVIAAMKANGTLQGRHRRRSCGAARPTRTRSGSSGQRRRLQPALQERHAIKKGPQQFVPDWDANNAATIFSQMLVKTSNNIQGVHRGERQHRRRRRRRPEGEGPQAAAALRPGRERRRASRTSSAGWQTGTVYKYVPDEANAAAAAAVALLKGKKPKTNTTRPNGKHQGADPGAAGRLDHEGATTSASSRTGS